VKLIDRPSPNHKARRAGVRVDTVLLHHTGSGPRDNSVAWLCNPESMVSAHYVVDRDGKVYRLVDEKRAALHAGLGRLPWEPEVGYDFNHRSVGVEIVNVGDGKEPFTEAQYRALGELVPAIVFRLADAHDGGLLRVRPVEGPPPGVDQYTVTGHRDVACDKAGRYGRKTDPADNFDWGRIRAALQPRST
jgi:N-acetylmuramoyl-L-alanine amidase